MENKIRKTTSKIIYYTYCFYCKNELINQQAKYCSRKCKDKHVRELKPEHYRQLKREYYKKYPEYQQKSINSIKEWNKNNPNKVKKAKKLWKQNNNDKVLESNKKSAIKNNHKEKTKFWDKSKRGKLREEFNLLKNNECEVCKSKKDLQVHHKEYTNNFEDWMLVCRTCHIKIHKDL